MNMSDRNSFNFDENIFNLNKSMEKEKQLTNNELPDGVNTKILKVSSLNTHEQNENLTKNLAVFQNTFSKFSDESKLHSNEQQIEQNAKKNFFLKENNNKNDSIILTNGLECSSVLNNLKCKSKIIKKDTTNFENFDPNKNVNNSKSLNETKSSKNIKRIGVFYSDFCDVFKSMRTFSLSNNSNLEIKNLISDFKQLDEKILIDSTENELNNSENKSFFKMVKNSFDQQISTNYKSTSSKEQNISNNTDATSRNLIEPKLETNVNKLLYNKKSNKMNLKIQKKSNKNKNVDISQDSLKQNSQLVLKIPAVNNENISLEQNSNINNVAINSCQSDNSSSHESNSENLQESSSISRVSIPTQTSNSVNTSENNNLLNESLSFSNSSSTNVNRSNINNLPDLLNINVPVQPYNTIASSNTNRNINSVNQNLTSSSTVLNNQQSSNSNNFLSLRQMPRLQPALSTTNVTAHFPVSNVGRSRSTTTLLQHPNVLTTLNDNTLLRVHQPLQNEFRDTLNRVNQISVTSSVPSFSTSNNSVTVPLTTVQPSSLPPHVHHHRLNFPLNTLNRHSYATAPGHFLNSDLDTITTQSKSCLSCTNMGLKWGILLIALIGLLCAITGTCLFAFRPSGRDNFTLAIIILCVGIVLIAVSSIVWKVSSDSIDNVVLPHINHDVHAAAMAAVCAANFHYPRNEIDIQNPVITQNNRFKYKLTQIINRIMNFIACNENNDRPDVFSYSNPLRGPVGANSSTGNLLEATNNTLNSITSNNTIYNHHHRRFLPRLPSSNNRSGVHHHPYGAMFYPEFDYRPPPPSYQASMQEYRLRMLLYERTNNYNINNNIDNVNINVDTNLPTNNNMNVQSITSCRTNSNQNNVQNNSGTFSGILSNLGNLVSTNFLNNNQNNSNNLRALSPPPIYRNTTTSIIAGALCRSLTFNSSTRGNSRPPSYRSVLVENNGQNNLSNAQSLNLPSCLNRTTSYMNRQRNQEKVFASSQLDKNKFLENIKDDIHRVTIHQTTTTSQVCTSNGINIVAITSLPINSNFTNSDNLNYNEPNNNEVQILAHL